MNFEMITKELFFDRQKVIDAMDRTQARILIRFGALVRIIARRSIRSSRKSSPPGQPPRSHEGSLKGRILFVADIKRRDVVIGPERIGSSNPPVPGLLEHGGTVPGRGQLILVGGSGSARDSTGRFKSTGRWVRADRPIRYEPRPFIGPAGRVALGQLPSIVRQERGRVGAGPRR